MLFFILSFIAGLGLIVAPVVLARFLSKQWGISKKLFWKIGFLHLVVVIIYFAVMGNFNSAFPQLEQAPEFLQAGIAGLVAGLFMELGRFVVLDRLMKTMRSFREGLYFAISWAGVYAFFVGIIAVINSFGMYQLVHITDLAAMLPEASTEQIQILAEAQKQAITLANGNPLWALSPLFDHTSFMLMDMALTLLIIFGLRRTEYRFVWSAVLLKAVFSTLSFYTLSFGSGWNELAVLAFGILAAALIFQLRKLFPSTKEHQAPGEGTI